MKPISWNSGKTWGDPNLRWGDPSYELEPGDPGYVPPAVPVPSINTKNRKVKSMPKGDFLKRSDDGLSRQLQTFSAAIEAVGTTVGVTPAEITAHNADADAFDQLIAAVSTLDTSSQAITAWKNTIRDGDALPPEGAPAPPTITLPPTTVQPGIVPRFRALVKKIKAHPSYSSAIGEQLGIEGAAKAAVDESMLSPDLTLTLDAGKVVVGWGWGGKRDAVVIDAVEIHVDRGDSQGFRLLAFDTTPDYYDTQPFPATPQKWTYKAVYRRGEERLGQWSKPVSVNVG